jgi:hypothetical protein
MDRWHRASPPRPEGAPKPVATEDGGLTSRARADRARQFYLARVAVLLTLLAAVILYAVRDHAARRDRLAWQRPLQIALVLLAQGELDPDALAAFEQRVPELERALEREFERYGGGFRPFRFHGFGPVPAREASPRASVEPGLFEPLRVSYALFWFARHSDEAAAVVGAFDGKIYVVLSPPRSEKRALVEGLGQDGGRIAVTRIELSADSVDFGLFVITHELFHLLGAGDRYAPDGTALLPEGLGDPEREPLYPQDSVEVMARGRVLEPGREVPPSDLAELRVGPQTAAEIGWLRPGQARPSGEVW